MATRSNRRKTKSCKGLGRIPSYRLHKASRQAVVTLGGRDIYLGRHGTKASEAEYNRLIAEWLAHGRQLPGDGAAPMTVAELMLAYVRHADEYYRRSDHSPTAEPESIRQALRVVKPLYADLPADQFGPAALRAVRARMILAGWCRTHINRQVHRVKAMFRWGVEQELLHPSVLEGLRAVRGLSRGRSEAKESDPVKPVPVAHIDAVRPYVSPQVEALIDLQLLTAARAGELTRMRAIDIDTAGAVWLFKPLQHKTAHHGHERTIYMGPKAQAIVRPFLAGRAVDAFLFSPAEADVERRAELNAARITPLSCGNRVGTNRKRLPKRRPGDRYSTASYRRSIHRAVAVANEAERKQAERVGREPHVIPIWSPHRLRHNAATELRRQFGLDVARVITGHKTLMMTAQYGELDAEAAQGVIAKVG